MRAGPRAQPRRPRPCGRGLPARGERPDQGMVSEGVACTWRGPGPCSQAGWPGSRRSPSPTRWGASGPSRTSSAWPAWPGFRCSCGWSSGRAARPPTGGPWGCSSRRGRPTGWTGRSPARLRQTSRLGQLLDPAADRLYIVATIIALAVRAIIPWWLVVALAVREVLMAVVLLVLRRHGWGSLQVSFVGKAATAALLYAFPLLFLGCAPVQLRRDGAGGRLGLRDLGKCTVLVFRLPVHRPGQAADRRRPPAGPAGPPSAGPPARNRRAWDTAGQDPRLEEHCSAVKVGHP